MNAKHRTKLHWSRLYGSVIRVHNLERCRAFYTRVLRLGEPVLSTNFWVEFELAPGPMVLALQQVNSVPEVPAATTGNVLCCLQVDNLGEFRRHLCEHGVQPLPTEELPVGPEFFRFHDPEGNPLMALAKH